MVYKTLSSFSSKQQNMCKKINFLLCGTVCCVQCFCNIREIWIIWEKFLGLLFCSFLVNFFAYFWSFHRHLISCLFFALHATKANFLFTFCNKTLQLAKCVETFLMLIYVNFFQTYQRTSRRDSWIRLGTCVARRTRISLFQVRTETP